MLHRTTNISFASKWGNTSPKKLANFGLYSLLFFFFLYQGISKHTTQPEILKQMLTESTLWNGDPKFHPRIDFKRHFFCQVIFLIKQSQHYYKDLSAEFRVHMQKAVGIVIPLHFWLISYSKAIFQCVLFYPQEKRCSYIHAKVISLLEHLHA